MNRITKKRLTLAAVIVTLLAIGILWFVFKYMLVDEYRQYSKGYTVEAAREFQELSDTGAGIKGFVLAAENNNYKLYTNLETTEIALMKKATGEIVYSNPQDRGEDQIATTATNQNELNATLVVKYYNSARTSATMTNYEMSIQSQQFTTQALEDGIRYVYTLSDSSKGTGIVPLQISLERMESRILSKLSKKESMTFTGAYKQSDGMYILTESAKGAPITISKLTKLLEKAGYTEEDLLIDNPETEDDKVGFVIPLEYRLVEDGLKVSVPTGMIEESGNASIYRIQLLKYMGAEKTGDGSGYILVPNGSGSLIKFKNGGSTQIGYSQYVYGTDPVSQSYTVVENTEDAKLPVYGIKGQQSCLFAMIIGGDALTSINADNAGKTTEYNNAYPAFSLREMELLNMFGISGMQSDTPSLEKNLYNVNLEVQYTLLSGEDANYSGMAKYYRDYLQKKEGLGENLSLTSIPLYLELIGGVEKKEHILGVPYMDVYPMTTFEQAGEIVAALQEKGVSNIRANYIGWFNGGIYHDVPDKIKLMKELGSKKDLERLTNQLEEQGGKLYTEVAFQKVPTTSKRYQYKIQSSKYYSGYVVSLGAVNPSTMRQTSALGWYNELLYSVLSPRFLPRYVESYTKQLEKVEVTGTALRDLGSVLASDKKKNRLIDRSKSLDIVKGMLAKLQEGDKEVLVKGGNAYSLPYADDLTAIPMNDNSFTIIDQEIPFYEMVIHGIKPYAGHPLNLASNYDHEQILLRYIEYGAYPNFTLSYQDSSSIKYTSSANLYSVQYTAWLDKVNRLYQDLNQVLKEVANAKMISHTLLENGLVRVSYDNGITIYLNYTQERLMDGETAVEAENYRMIGGMQE